MPTIRRWLPCVLFVQAAISSPYILAQEITPVSLDSPSVTTQTANLPRAGTPVITPLPAPDSLATSRPSVSIEMDDFGAGFDQGDITRVNIYSMYEHHRVTGPGRDASFLEPGSHWLHDLELDLKRSVNENWTTEFSSLVRATDSRRHDPQNWSLQRLQLIAYDEMNHVSLGDYYATLSQYTFNRSIKGVGYQRTLTDSSYLRLVGGSMHSRWNHLVDRVEDEPMDRNAMGLRYQMAGDAYRLGFNLASGRDRKNDPTRTFEDAYRQVLPGVDWEYRLQSGFRFSGEHAYAWTKKEDINQTEETLKGSANRLNADGSLGALRLRGRAERVGSDFYTMAGGAAVDRLRYYARGDYRLTPVWSSFVAYDWSQNNLSGHLADTTTTRVPEVGVSARGLFDRRSLTMTTSYRQRVVSVDSDPNSRAVSDRVFLSVGDRFGEVSLRGEVEAILNSRKEVDRQSNDDYLYRIIADSRFVLADGRYDLRPYLSLERQEIEDPTSGKMVRTNGARLDLRLLAPKNIDYTAMFEVRDVSNNIPNGEDTRLKRYGIGVDSRPDFMSGGSLRAEAGYADYRFGDADKNYRERYIRLIANIPFDFGS